LELPGLARLQLQAIVVGLPSIDKAFSDTDPNQYYIRHAEISYDDSSLLSRAANAVKKENGTDPDTEVANFIQMLKDAPSDGASAEGAPDLITFLNEYKTPKGSLKITFNPTSKLSVTSLDFEKIVMSFFEGTAAKDFGAKISYETAHSSSSQYKSKKKEIVEILLNNHPSVTPRPDDSTYAHNVVIDTYLSAACQQAWNQIVEKSGTAFQANPIPDAGVRIVKDSGRIEYRYEPKEVETGGDIHLNDVDLCGLYTLPPTSAGNLTGFHELQGKVIPAAKLDIQNFIDLRYGGRWEGSPPHAVPSIAIDGLTATYEHDPENVYLSLETVPPKIAVGDMPERSPAGSLEHDLSLIMVRFQEWVKQEPPASPAAERASPPTATVTAPTPHYAVGDFSEATGVPSPAGPPPSATDRAQEADQIYTEGHDGQQYSPTINPDGSIALTSSSGIVVTLTKSCAARSQKYGNGSWSWANGGFLITFPDKKLGFPRQELVIGNNDGCRVSASEETISQAGDVFLQCESETERGTMTTIVSIDSKARFVKMDEKSLGLIIEYRNGAVGSILAARTDPEKISVYTRETLVVMEGLSGVTHQFVNIGENTIDFGDQDDQGTTTLSLDRRTLKLRMPAGIQQCVLLPSEPTMPRRQF
jgi:hypothetical protein